MKVLRYLYSEYYNKYGDTFKELEGFAYKMDKEWDTYIVMFDELSQVEDNYWSLLLSDYLEDLNAFALMYRNVSLGYNSILDKAFFLSKMNNLKGYKQRIYSQQVSRKELLVRYYIEYGDLFEMFCKKQGIDLFAAKNTSPYTIEQYQQYKNKVFGNSCGINYLSDRQCSILLDRIDELKGICANTDYAIDYPICNDKRQFVVDRVIPYYFGVNIQYKELINNFSNTYYKKHIEQFFSTELYERGKRCFELQKDYQKLQDYRFSKYPQLIELEKKMELLSKPETELYILRNRKNVGTKSLMSEILSPVCYSYINLYETETERYERERRERKEKEERERKEREERERRLKEKLEKEKQLIREIEGNKEALFALNKEITLINQHIDNDLKLSYELFIEETISLLDNSHNCFWWFLFNNQNGLQSLHDQPIKEKYVEYLRSHPIKWIKCKSLPSRFYSISTIESYDSKRFDSIIQTRRDSIDRRSAANQWKLYIKEIVKKHEEEERTRCAEEERKRREAEEKRLEQYRFNIRNKHWRDDNISFRKADHVYIVDGTPLDSVTTFVKNCFPEFNSEFHAKRKAETLGITKEEVLKMWDKKGRESREQGTAMHEKIESYYLGKPVSTDETFELFKIFANKITLKPYRTEWAVYDWEQKIAGTIDFVDYQNGEYIIYDWKRSDKLIAKNGLPIKNSQYGEKALPPIENLDDSPYYHYALQLSLYKYILEKNYGITVSKLRLGIFHPSYNKPYVLEMPYLRNEIDTLFGYRSEVIF